MPTIDEYRAKFPQYDDMSDQQFADSMYKKFYSDMPRDQFNAKLGYNPAAADPAPVDPDSLFPKPAATPETPPPQGIMQQAFGDNAVGNALDTFNDATTGAGAGASANLKDEILAGMASPFRAGYDALTSDKGFDLGNAYDTELANQRAIQHGAEKRSPIAETVGEVGGSLALGGGKGTAAALDAVPAAADAVASTIPRAIGKGMVTGGGTGALYGFGAGEGGVENRLESAGEGAAVGGITGGIVGGVAGGLARRAARKANAASGADSGSFYELSSDAYDKLHSLGAYEQTATDKLINDMTAAAKAGRVSKTRNADVWGTIDDMAAEFKDQGATPGTLEEIRKVINSDLLSDPKQRRAGKIIRDVIDNFAQSGEGGSAGKEARGFFRQAIQLQKIEDVVNEATNTAGRGSQNATLHLKVGIQKLLRQDKAAMLKGRPAQFDPPMRAKMEELASTGNRDKFMQWLGKMGADGGLGALGHSLLAIGSHGGSLMYQVPVAISGHLAKKSTEAATRANIDSLINLIAQNEHKDPVITARARKLLQALTRGTVAATQ